MVTTAKLKLEAVCGVARTDDGNYLVMLTLSPIPDEDTARQIAEAVEQMLNDYVNNIGGNAAGWVSDDDRNTRKS